MTVAQTDAESPTQTPLGHLDQTRAGFDGVDQEIQNDPGTSSQAQQKPRLKISADTCAIALGYFVQGVKTSMAITAEKFLMKDNLQMSPAKAALWLELARGAWIIKPAFGFVTDCLPILGERRRPYLVLCGFVGATAYVLLGFSNGIWVALAFMSLAEASIALSDVVVDGMVVERCRLEPQELAGSLQSLCWGSQAVGGLASASAGGWIIELTSARVTLFVMAFFPLLISLTALMIKKEHHNISLEPNGDVEAESLVKHSDGSGGKHQDSIGHQVRKLFSALKSKPILWPLLFIFIWNAWPDINTSMFYFYTNELHFSAEFIGFMQLLNGLTQLIGVLIYNLYLKKIAMRKVFTGICIICTIAGLTQIILVTGFNRTLGLSDKLFVVADAVVIEALTRIAMMPVFVLAARICPQDVEATLYATLMAVSNAGVGAGRLQGALFTDLMGITANSFHNMVWLVVLSTLLRLTSLLFLWLLPKQEPGSDDISVDSNHNRTNASDGHQNA